MEPPEFGGRDAADPLENFAERTRVCIADAQANFFYRQVCRSEQSLCVLHPRRLKILLEGHAGRLLEFPADERGIEVLGAANLGERDVFRVVGLHVVAEIGYDPAAAGFRSSRNRPVRGQNEYHRQKRTDERSIADFLCFTSLFGAFQQFEDAAV